MFVFYLDDDHSLLYDGSLEKLALADYTRRKKLVTPSEEVMVVKPESELNDQSGRV